MADIILIGILSVALGLLVVLLVAVSMMYSQLGRVQQQVDEAAGSARTLAPVVSSLHESVTQISASAAEIKTLGMRYKETERLTRKVHDVLLGSYSKGRSGEKMLASLMSELIKIGYVRANEAFGSRVVEYAVCFDDGRLLAVDSKVVSTRDVTRFFADECTEDEKIHLADKICKDAKKKVDEVAKYIDTKKTLPFAVMAVPDSVFEIISSIIPLAIRKNVIVTGYLSVPQLITYFVRIHSFYRTDEDTLALQEKIFEVNQILGRFDESYFSNRFEKPLRIISNASGEVQDVIRAAHKVSVKQGEPKP